MKFTDIEGREPVVVVCIWRVDTKKSRQFDRSDVRFEKKKGEGPPMDGVEAAVERQIRLVDESHLWR